MKEIIVGNIKLQLCFLKDFVEFKGNLYADRVLVLILKAGKKVSVL